MQESLTQFKIAPQSLDEQVANVIREQILSGRFPPGFRLKEVQLSQQFNLSRGTIRAALQQLTHEGLVTQVMHRGWTVTSLSSEDIWELFTLRNVLESFAARLTAERIVPTKVKTLQVALVRLAEAVSSKDFRQIINADFDLHQTIVELSDHRRLQAQYHLIEQQIRLYIACCDSLFADLDDLTAQHQQLVEAICSGNGALAEQTAREHNADGKIFAWYQQVAGSPTTPLS